MNVVEGRAYVRPLTSLYTLNQNTIPTETSDSWANINAEVDLSGYSSLAIDGISRGYICGYAQLYHNGKFVPKQQFQIEPPPWGWMGDYIDKDFNLQGMLKHLKTHLFYTMDSIKGSSWLVLGQDDADLSNRRDQGKFGQLIDHIEGMGSSPTTKATYAKLGEGEWGYDGTVDYFKKYYGIMFVLNGGTVIQPEMREILTEAIRQGVRFIVMQRADADHEVFNSLFNPLGIASTYTDTGVVLATRSSLILDKSIHKDHISWTGIKTSLNSHRSIGRASSYTFTTLTDEKPATVSGQLGNWVHVYDASYDFPEEAVKADTPHFFREKCCVDPGDIFETDFTLESYPYKPDDWRSGREKGTHILEWQNEDRFEPEVERYDLSLRSASSAKGFVFVPQARVVYSVPTDVSTASMFNDPKTAGKWGPNTWAYNGASDSVRGLQNLGWSGAFNKDHLNLEDYSFEAELGVVGGDGGDDDAIGLMFRIQVYATGALKSAYYMVMDRTIRTTEGIHWAGGTGLGGSLYLIKTKKGTAGYGLSAGIPIKKLRNSGWDPGVWYKYRIECVGTRIRIWENGVLLCDVEDTDPEMSKGAFGPTNLSQIGCSFKNFKYFESEAEIVEGPRYPAHITDANIDEESKVDITTLTAQQLLAGVIQTAYESYKKRTGRITAQLSVNYYTAKSETEQVIVKTLREGTEVFYAWGSPTVIFESEAWAKYRGEIYPGEEGYNIITLDRTTKQVVDFRTYNPGMHKDAEAAGVAISRAMSEYLRTLTSNEVVGIFTSSKVRDNRLRGGLPESMYWLGGSEDKFGSDNMSDKSEYVPIYDQSDAVKLEGIVLRYQGKVDRTVRLNFRVAAGSNGASWSGAGKNPVLNAGVASTGGYFTKSNETVAGDKHGVLSYIAWAETYGGRVAGSITLKLLSKNPNLDVALVQDPNESNQWTCRVDISNKTEVEQDLDLTVETVLTYNSSKYQTGYRRSADPANYILIGSPDLNENNAYSEILKNGVDSEGYTHLEARYKWGREDVMYPTNGELELIASRELNSVSDFRYTKKMERHWGSTTAGFKGDVYIEDVRFKKLPMHHRDDFIAHVQHPCVTFQNSPDFTVNDIDFAECSKTSFSETTYYNKVRGLLDDQDNRMYVGVFEEELQRVIFDASAIKFTNLEMRNASTAQMKYQYFIQCLNWLRNANRPKTLLLLGDTEDGVLEFSVKESRVPTVQPVQEIDPATGKPRIDPSTQEPLLDPETGEPLLDPETGLPMLDPETGTPFPAPELTDAQKLANKGFGRGLPALLRAEGWTVEIKTYNEVEAMAQIPAYLNSFGILLYVGSKRGVADTESVNLATFIETAVKNGLGMYLTTLGSLFSESINGVAVRFAASFTSDAEHRTTNLTASKAKYEDHLTYGALAGSFVESDGKETGSLLELEIFSKITKMEDFCRPILKGNSGKVSVAAYELQQARAVFDAGVPRNFNILIRNDPGENGMNINTNSNNKMLTKKIMSWICTKPNNKKVLFLGDNTTAYDHKGTGSFGMTIYADWLRALGYTVTLLYASEISNPNKAYFDNYAAVIFTGIFLPGVEEIPKNFCVALEESIRAGTGFYCLSDSNDGGPGPVAKNSNKLSEPFLVRWKGFINRSYHDIDASRLDYGDHPIISGLTGRILSDSTEGEIEILGVSSKQVMFTISASEPVRGEPISMKVRTRNGSAQALSESNSSKYILHDPFGTPFGGYLDDDRVRVVFDGGFPKYYNGTFNNDYKISTPDPLCDSNIKLFVRNCLNWLNPKHRAKRVLLVGDRGGTGVHYDVKDASSSAGFNGPYVAHMRRLGWSVEVKYHWDLGPSPSPLLFDQYAAVIFLSSDYRRNDNPSVPYEWAKALESSVKRGTGLMLITDHSGGESPAAGSFQSNANRIANLFYATFYGYVDRTYASVDASRNTYGSHPLIQDMKGNMQAFSSEGIVRSEGTFGELQDYVAVDETITFFPGEQHKEVPVTILCDNVPEADEDFYLVLSDIDRGEIIKKEGRAVILDDDGIPFGTQTVTGDKGITWNDLNYKNSTGVFIIDFETWIFDYAANPDQIGEDDRIDVYRDGIWQAASPFGSAAVYDRSVTRYQSLPHVSKNTKVFMPHYAELGHSAQYESRVQCKTPTGLSAWRFVTMEEPVQAVPATIDYITDKFAHRYVIHDVKGRARVGQQTIRVTVRNKGRVEIQQVRVVQASIIGPGTMEFTLDVDVFKYVEIYGALSGLDYDIEVL